MRAVSEFWEKRHPSFFCPLRVCIHLVDDMVRRFVPGFFRIIRGNEEKLSASEPDFGRRFTDFLKFGEIAAIEIFGDVNADIPVAILGGATKRGRSKAADPQRRSWFLNRLRREFYFVYLIIASFERERLAVPEPANNLQPFVGPSPTFFTGDGEPFKLFNLVS